MVIGGDAKEVAAALTAGAKKAGLLSEDKTAAAVKDMEDPLAVGVFSVGKGIVDGFKLMERQTPAPTFSTTVARPGAAAGPKPDEKPPEMPKLSKRAEKTIEDAAKAVDALPPTVLSLGRTPDGLTLEVKQTGLKSVSVKVIDLFVHASLDRVVEMQSPMGP